MADEVQKPAETPGKDDFLNRVDENLKDIDSRYTEKSEALDKKADVLKKSVSDLNEKIGKATTAGKDSEAATYTRQLSDLMEKLQKIDAQRASLQEQKTGQTDRVAERVGDKAGKIEDQVKDRTTLEATIKQLDEKIAESEGSTEPSTLNERARFLQERAEAKKQLGRLNEKSDKAALQAQAAAAHKLEDELRPKELAEAEEAVDAALEAAEKEKTGEEETTDDKTSEEPEAEANKEPGTRSKDWNESWSGTAFSLAKGLADNPPDPDSTVEKFMYQGKGFLLRIVMAFSKNHEWVNELDKNQKETLKQTIGLVVTDEKDDKGKTVIKWIKPNPDYVAPDRFTVSIFEAAYEDPEKGMAQVTAETTLADLAKDESNQKLVDALKKSGAKDADKVLTYIDEHGTAVKEALSGGDAPKTTETAETSAEKSLVDILKEATLFTPSQVRDTYLRGSVLDALSGENANYPFDGNTKTSEAVSNLLKTEGPEKDFFTEDSKSYAQKAADDLINTPFDNTKVYPLASLVSVGAMSADEAQSTLKGIETHSLDAAGKEKLIVSLEKFHSTVLEVLSGNLKQALEEFKPNTDKEREDVKLALSRLGTPPVTTPPATN